MVASHLAACDRPKRNDLDGRGHLSEVSLADVTRFVRLELEDVLQAARARILGLLRRRGKLEAEPDAQPPGLLDGLAASSITGHEATRRGAQPGPPPPREARAFCVEQEGFPLHAGVSVPSGTRQREALERLCRYVTRRRWRPSGCTSAPTAGWSTSCGTRGRTGRWRWCCSRGRCCRDWRRWCRRRGRTC